MGCRKLQGKDVNQRQNVELKVAISYEGGKVGKDCFELACKMRCVELI